MSKYFLFFAKMRFKFFLYEGHPNHPVHHIECIDHIKGICMKLKWYKNPCQYMGNHYKNVFKKFVLFVGHPNNR